MMMVAQQNGDQIAKSNTNNDKFQNLSWMSMWMWMRTRQHRQRQLETISQPRQPNQSTFGQKLAAFQAFEGVRVGAVGVAAGGIRLQLVLLLLLCNCIGKSKERDGESEF